MNRSALRERRTVAMETGCQNIQLCSTILKMAFPPEMIGPLFLFPLVYVSFQMMEAGVLIVLFWCYQRFTFTEKGKQAFKGLICSFLSQRIKANMKL